MTRTISNGCQISETNFTEKTEGKEPDQRESLSVKKIMLGNYRAHHPSLKTPGPRTQRRTETWEVTHMAGVHKFATTTQH